VECTGGPVHDADGEILQPGDVVTFLDVHGTCHDCWYCDVAKASTRCPNRRVYGITYSAKEGLLGGWSEKIYLKPGVKIVKVPSTVPPEAIIGGGCGLPTAFHAVERGGVRLAASVVVQGSGPVGLNAALLSILAGACQVIMVGAPKLRLEFARTLGVDEVINIEEVSVRERVEQVRALTGGRGADIVIEATGVPAAVKEGLAMTRDCGTYVVVGQYTDHGEVTLNPHWEINKKHVDIRGTWGIDFSHFYRALKVLAKHNARIGWERFITNSYSLAEANQALRDVEEQKVITAVIDPRAAF
ncbi:MAG: zinc-binding dehydrogenase, partial [Firmicutes bacterium]|nr:zinc-binding dehydrogenase [Bacillota bacterium]